MDRRSADERSDAPLDDGESAASPNRHAFKKPFNWKAPAIIVGFELLESIAYSGVSLNLVIYLAAVLHGTTAQNAAQVDTWNGTTFIVPVIAAAVADSYLGKYKTIAISIVFYLLGLVLITLAAVVPSLRPAACQGFECPPATGPQHSVFFLALYLMGIGTGGVKSALLPFGADQYDDADPEESRKKQSFFSWFFAAVNLGIFISGTLIVWLEQNVAWGLGFGIGALCLLIAALSFFAGTPTYRMQLPTGSPLKIIARVLVASFKNRKIPIRSDYTPLYETEDKGHQKLAHTEDIRCLDKAAAATGRSHGPWELCSVTEVEQVKVLVRMLPIWLNCLFYGAAVCQMVTTFIQQGVAMDNKIGRLAVPPASMISIEVVIMLVWVLFQDKLLIPLARWWNKTPEGLSRLQRMGIGRFLIILSMMSAALVEEKRLASAGAGSRISIGWQVPQFAILAGSDVFAGIAQLDFFYSEAPETMRSICSAFSFLALSLGYYLNSLVITVVAAATRTKGSKGWIPQDLNEGHLDYYFWLWTAISAANFVLFVLFAKKYTSKKVVPS